MRNKPVSLVGLSFFDQSGNNVVSESETKTFHDFKTMQIYIDNRVAYWSDMFNEKLIVEPHSIETLIRSEAQAVLKYVCEFMQVDYKSALSESRDVEFIEARRFTINICHERKMFKSSIAKGLNVHHATVIYHINQFEKLSSTDKAYKKLFIDAYEFVMERIGGNFRNDGSGKLIKINNHKHEQ